MNQKQIEKNVIGEPTINLLRKTDKQPQQTNNNVPKSGLDGVTSHRPKNTAIREDSSGGNLHN